MAKIELNTTVAVTAAWIEEQLAKIYYLLTGRLDDNNVADASINKEYVNDIAYDDNAVGESHKFFANTTTESSNGETPEKLLTRAADLLEDNPSYLLLTGTGIKSYTAETTDYESLKIQIDKPSNYEIETWDNGKPKVWVDLTVEHSLGSVSVNDQTLATFITSISISFDKIIIDIVKNKEYSVTYGSSEFINVYANVYAKAKRLL